MSVTSLAVVVVVVERVELESPIFICTLNTCYCLARSFPFSCVQ